MAQQGDLRAAADDVDDVELLINEIQALDNGEPHQHFQERFTPALVVRSSSEVERIAVTA